ncbi:MAG TPA: hypothetical protein VFB16_13040 [Bauldia sp.]|nr:hypothetical protein [Bauldia sp.]
MIRKKLAPAIVAGVLAASTLPAFADVSEDIGGLIAFRDEITRVMDYCFKNVKQDQTYIQARDVWLIRNQADIKAIADALQKVGGISADEQKQIDDIINKQVETDVTGQANKEAFCTGLAGEMKGGTTRDLSVLPGAQERMQRVRDYLATP